MTDGKPDVAKTLHKVRKETKAALRDLKRAVALLTFLQRQLSTLPRESIVLEPHALQAASEILEDITGSATLINTVASCVALPPGGAA